MIFSVWRSQYCISNISKSQQLFVTRHRLSCAEVNLRNKLVTWAWDTCDFTSYSACFVLFRFVECHKPKSSTMPAAFITLLCSWQALKCKLLLCKLAGCIHIQCAGSNFAKSFNASGSEGKVFMKTFRIIG